MVPWPPSCKRSASLIITKFRLPYKSQVMLNNNAIYNFDRRFECKPISLIHSSSLSPPSLSSASLSRSSTSLRDVGNWSDLLTSLWLLDLRGMENAISRKFENGSAPNLCKTMDNEPSLLNISRSPLVVGVISAWVSAMSPMPEARKSTLNWWVQT